MQFRSPVNGIKVFFKERLQDETGKHCSNSMWMILLVFTTSLMGYSKEEWCEILFWTIMLHTNITAWLAQRAWKRKYEILHSRFTFRT